VADVRSLSDRLVARHEAHQALLLVELERADSAWATSVSALEACITDIRRSWASEVHARGLEGTPALHASAHHGALPSPQVHARDLELHRLHASAHHGALPPSPQVHARDLELHRRQSQLDALTTKLEEAEERHTFESRIAATDGRTLKAEVVRLETALEAARLEHGRLEKEKQKLIVQCVNQSADAGSASEGLQQRLRQEQQARAEMQERAPLPCMQVLTTTLFPSPQARAEMQERADGLLAIEKEQRRAREIELQHEIARERKASEVREALIALIASD
jgi:hypothetical protein